MNLSFLSNVNGNIRRSLTRNDLVFIDQTDSTDFGEIDKILFRKISFSNPVAVIALSSADGCCLLNLLFEVGWSVKILIISLVIF